VALASGPGVDVAPEGASVVARAPAELEGELFRTADLRLIGRHNVRNGALALAAARLAGAGAADARAAAAAFEPVPHRLELVAVDARSVRYVNDSIATNPDASIAALEAIAGPIVLLCGGSEKPLDYAGWGAAAAARAHAVVCTGVSGPKLAAAVEAAVAGASGARVERVARFDDAFARARALCPDGGAVLLAPATASFDEFSGFEARGERFRTLARAAATGREP
jgi:UDP-N-acetylmuramoylalanine--D-glutamate ligase